MSVKRSFATGRVGHLNHDKFPMITGQWKAFENLASDIRKSGLLGACLTVAPFTHWTVPRSDRGANDYGGASPKQQGARAPVPHVAVWTRSGPSRLTRVIAADKFSTGMRP